MIDQRPLPPPPRLKEPPEEPLELPPPPRPKELLPPRQFAQVELQPLEGALNDLLGALKDLPNPSEDLKLRLSAEGWFEDLPLVTLELLKDLPSLGEDTRESISSRLSKLFG